MLTSLRQLEGLPVILQDEQIGYVERALPDEEIRRLGGLVIRQGLKQAKWVSAESIEVLGKKCVLIALRPETLEKNRITPCHPAFFSTGQNAGQVTDGLLCTQTLRLLALEISAGPVFRLLGKSGYAREYRVQTHQGEKQAIVRRLLSWAELTHSLGKEESQWI